MFGEDMSGSESQENHSGGNLLQHNVKTHGCASIERDEAQILSSGLGTAADIEMLDEKEELENKRDTVDHDPWVVDSGCTRHTADSVPKGSKMRKASGSLMTAGGDLLDI